MHVLVVGLRDLDAGKTTFARGLVGSLSRRGVDVIPFKPWSASSLWKHHDAVVRALEGGLASRDARRLLAAAGRDPDPRRVNPVHRVWRPRSALEPGRSPTVPLVDRVAREDEVTHVVHGGEDLPAPLPAVLDEAGAVERAPDEPTLRALQSELHRPAVEEAWERLEAARDEAGGDPPGGGSWILTESYSDVALPPGLAAEPDAVVAVEPGRAHRFDGGRYRKALELRSGMRGAAAATEPPTSDLLELLTPEESAALPPLAEGDRGDAGAVADVYGDAIARVLPEAGDPGPGS